MDQYNVTYDPTPDHVQAIRDGNANYLLVLEHQGCIETDRIVRPGRTVLAIVETELSWDWLMLQTKKIAHECRLTPAQRACSRRGAMAVIRPDQGGRFFNLVTPDPCPECGAHMVPVASKYVKHP